MKIDCCMITTNLHDRLHLVENTVNSIEKHSDIFNKKIMSIDTFPNGAGLVWFKKFHDNGWQLTSKQPDISRSMILNQRNAILKAETDIILYSEDDIIINNLPKLSTINKLFNENIVNGKRTGFICFNNHIYVEFTQNPKHIIDFIHDLNNYINIDGDIFMVKNQIIRDSGYYLNFPVAITRKDLFLELQNHAMIHHRGVGVEVGMTDAWFSMGKDKEYEVLISLKPQIIDDIKSGKYITVMDFYNYANINFWNNDLTLRHHSINGRSATIF